MSRKYSAKGDYGREEKSKEQNLWLKDTKISQKSLKCISILRSLIGVKSA